MMMTDVDVNMALLHVSHSSPGNVIALSQKVFNMEACVDAYGRVVPRWYRSIIALCLDLIRLTFGSAAGIPCVVVCFSVYGKFNPL